MLDFYYATDTCALATHIVLEDVGVDYVAHRVSFASGDQKSDDFVALNPKARVPVLITPSGILTETPAMMVYVAQLSPDADLACLSKPFAFAKVQEFNSYICSTLHVAHAHRMRGSRWADGEAAHEAMRAKVPESVGQCYRYLEDHVFVGPYVMGDRYTIADAYLFTVAQWMEGDGVDPADYPKIAAHRDLLSRRASVRAALETETAEDLGAV